MVDKSRCKKLSLIALEMGRRQIMLTVKDDLFGEIYWDMVRIIPHKGRSRGHRLGRV